MQSGGEKLGFGRGGNVDHRRLFRQELEEADLEMQEDREILDRGFRQFEQALGDCVLGGRLASDYEAVVKIVDHEALAEPNFWKEVLKIYRDSITPHGLFTALPVDVQSDNKIQEIFFNQPTFDISFIPRAILERSNPSLVNQQWLEMKPSEFNIRRTPWKLLSILEKREYIESALQEHNTFLQLEKARKEFADAIPSDEWDGIAREQYTKHKELVLKAVKKDFDRVTELFSKEELRDILEEIPALGREPMFFDLSLPLLRKLEFAEAQVAEWKENAEGIESLSNGFEDYDKMDAGEREWVLSLCDKRASHYPGYESFIREKLPDLLQKLPPASVEPTLDALIPLLSKFELSEEELSDGLLRPIIEAQGASAFRTFEMLYRVVDCFDQGNIYLLNLLCPDAQSAKVFREAMSKTGSRFQDFMSFYLDTRFTHDDHGELKIHSETVALGYDNNLIDFIDSGLPWTPEVFLEFNERIEAGERPSQVIEEIREKVREDIGDIQDGEWPEEGLNEYQFGLLSHVFPPALGVSREEYARLVQRREDRQYDVPFELAELQGHQVALPLGKWELRTGEEFETRPWNRIAKVAMEVNGMKIVTEEREQLAEDEIAMDPNSIVEVGRAMIGLLTGRGGATREALLKDAYALYLARGGSKLPDLVVDRETAVRAFEWSKDSFRDVIEVAITAYRNSNPDRFDQEVGQALHKDIAPRARKRIAGAITGVMKSRMPEPQKAERVSAILESVDISLEGDVLEALEQAMEQVDGAVDTALENLIQTQRGVSVAESTKLSQTIADKIMGADSEAMKTEMAKWTFVEGAEGGEERELSFMVTKKKLHAVVGLNMGVCVAVDDQLWNKPEFMNVVMFGEDGVARGGMHFEVVKDGGKKYLSLPGINPSLTLLREVSSEKVTRAMLDYAVQCARAMKMDGILIPTNPTIFSNREELHGVIREMELETHELDESHQFSYSPFAYSWKEAFVVDVN